MTQPTILLIGTADTKADELGFIRERMENQQARVVIMDVGVLGEPPFTPEISKHDVAIAANTTNKKIIALGNEHEAMMIQAVGATRLAAQLANEQKIDGVLAIGGTMATDLALDVVGALPLGLPKFIVSTVAFSAILPPERICADVMMILWSGGLYGLNSVCESILSQAAGAVVGASRSSQPIACSKPLIGMTSLGSSTLKYMKLLKPEIEKRGFELAVFHTTGMGGRAFESLAAKKQFAAVMDFSLIEVCDEIFGSAFSSGTDRLEAAGKAGIPQIVAPGGVTLLDICPDRAIPERFKDREIYTHNRLVACAKITAEERAEVAKVITRKLNGAIGPSAIIMPLQGIDEWDKEGGPFHDEKGLAVFAQTIKQNLDPKIEHHEIPAHINDLLFANTALEILDRWIKDGSIKI